MGWSREKTRLLGLEAFYPDDSGVKMETFE